MEKVVEERQPTVPATRLSDFFEKVLPEKRHLYYSAIAANLLYVSLGCSVAWPSAAIPLLRQRGLKSHQETWMVSLLMLGSCFGPTIYSSSIDRFGRKYSLLLTGVIYLISWLILGLSDDIYSLYIGRFIGGLAVGSTFNCIPVYISEISDVNMRQTLTSLTEFFISLGCLIEYAAGPWLTYGNLVLVSAVPSLIFGLATARVPESPYHLVARGRTQQAFETLVLLRGPSQEVSDDLAQIERSLRESETQTVRRIDLIQKKGPRKALLISSLMLFVVPFAAVDVVVSYLEPILSTTSIPLTSSMATLLVGVLEVVFGAFEPLVVHRFGSKWTLVICSVFCSLCLLSFGVYKYFDERHYEMSSLTALPIACIVLFDMFFVLGVGALAWSISVELFPPSLKGFGINIVTTMNWIVDFIVVTLYGDLSPIIGASICFIFFSIVLLIGTILIAIFVPNTKGFSLHTIQENLDR